MEQRVLVKVRICGQPLGRRPLAEDRPHGHPEHLGQIEVDRPDGPVEIHLLVHEPAGGQEHVECTEARFEQGQPVGADERVAPQPLDVDGSGGDPGEVRVTAHVIQVVHGEHPGQQRGEPTYPVGHRGIRQRRLGDEKGDPRGVDRFIVRERIPFRHRAGGTAQPAQQRPKLVLDDPRAKVLVGQPLGIGSARVRRCLEISQDVVVEEVGKWTVPHVVQQAGHPEGLDDEPL